MGLGLPMCVLLAAAAAGATAATPPTKPNIVFILTDDQDVLLGGLQPMPRTRQLLQDRGATLANFFVNTPICCPSRSEYVSGRYFHNHGAPGGSCMHVAAEDAVFSRHSIFAQLSAAGWATGVFGKVTNDQNKYFCERGGPDAPGSAGEATDSAEWWTGEPGGERATVWQHAAGNNVAATGCERAGGRCHDAGNQSTAAACQSLCAGNSTCLWFTYGAAHTQCWLGYSASWEPWKSPVGEFPSGCKASPAFPACAPHTPAPPPGPVNPHGRVDGMTFVNAPCVYNDFWATKYLRKFANGTQYFENLPPGPSSYQTSQMGNRTVAWIEEMIEAATPFFAWVGPHAPHYPADPAPWHQTAFAGMTAPRTPSFNVAAKDHHRMLAQEPPMDAACIDCLDQQFRDRWQSLISVDELVEAVVLTLEKRKVLDSTYILYTSDHGYHLGQHRVPSSKMNPYDTDIRVPALICGPGIRPGSTMASVVGNVDVAPTLLSLAGIIPPPVMDGKSMAKLLLSPSDDDMLALAPAQRSIVSEALEAAAAAPGAAGWRDQFLVEYMSVATRTVDGGNPESACVNTNLTNEHTCVRPPASIPAYSA